MRLGGLLRAELFRLDALAVDNARVYAIGPDNLAQELPNIIKFTERYHRLYMQYLDAVLPQHTKPIQCRPACGNCCHHYPMSVEPFELVYLYANLRKRDDLLGIMEACQARSSMFENFFEKRRNQDPDTLPRHPDPAKAIEYDGSDSLAEDVALHDYFSAWKPCPFSNPVGDCMAYKIRPVSCRMYFSESDPKFCTPEHLLTPDNDSYIVYLPDLIEYDVYRISEHYTPLELPESFFGGLLAVNAYEGILG